MKTFEIEESLKALLTKGKHGDFFIYRMEKPDLFLQARLDLESVNGPQVILGLPLVEWTRSRFEKFRSVVSKSNFEYLEYSNNGIVFLDVFLTSDLARAAFLLETLSREALRTEIVGLDKNNAPEAYLYLLNNKPYLSLSIGFLHFILLASFWFYELMRMGHVTAASISNFDRYELVLFLVFALVRWPGRFFVMRHLGGQYSDEAKSNSVNNQGVFKRFVIGILVFAPVILAFVTT